ncbi:hypothetical protein H5410_020789 [Solanum commersonii]|uniref:Uncharacterized protein n=1 Tax=Solanum commersonii TaxID=4109 RepID=A0A9J5ZDB5_SOLCO|nr:hypothetical protein H5410_020789 [Solanum commersonii]
MVDQHLKGTDDISVAWEIVDLRSSIQQLVASMAALVPPTPVPSVDLDRYHEPESWVNRPESLPAPPTLCHKLALVDLGRFYGINPEARIFQAELVTLENMNLSTLTYDEVRGDLIAFEKMHLNKRGQEDTKKKTMAFKANQEGKGEEEIGKD